MIKITWLGTASILLEACGQKLLFDPFVELAGGSNPNTLEDFEGVRDICITHGHPPYIVPLRLRARWRAFWRTTGTWWLLLPGITGGWES